jgi:hypothetical protein
MATYGSSLLAKVQEIFNKHLEELISVECTVSYPRGATLLAYDRSLIKGVTFGTLVTAEHETVLRKLNKEDRVRVEGVTQESRHISRTGGLLCGHQFGFSQGGQNRGQTEGR